jgi:hypothetical protein
VSSAKQHSSGKCSGWGLPSNTHPHLKGAPTYGLDGRSSGRLRSPRNLPSNGCLGRQGAVCRWVNQNLAHSPPTSAEVKDTWIYTSAPPLRLHGAELDCSARPGTRSLEANSFAQLHNRWLPVTMMCRRFTDEVRTSTRRLVIDKDLTLSPQ